MILCTAQRSPSPAATPPKPAEWHQILARSSRQTGQLPDRMAPPLIWHEAIAAALEDAEAGNPELEDSRLAAAEDADVSASDGQLPMVPVPLRIEAPHLLELIDSADWNATCSDKVAASGNKRDPKKGSMKDV
jgi:hypothetical protein